MVIWQNCNNTWELIHWWPNQANAIHGFKVFGCIRLVEANNDSPDNSPRRPKLVSQCVGRGWHNYQLPQVFSSTLTSLIIFVSWMSWLTAPYPPTPYSNFNVWTDNYIPDALNIVWNLTLSLFDQYQGEGILFIDERGLLLLPSLISTSWARIAALRIQVELDFGNCFIQN